MSSRGPKTPGTRQMEDLHSKIVREMYPPYPSFETAPRGTMGHPGWHPDMKNFVPHAAFCPTTMAAFHSTFVPEETSQADLINKYKQAMSDTSDPSRIKNLLDQVGMRAPWFTALYGFDLSNPLWPSSFNLSMQVLREITYHTPREHIQRTQKDLSVEETETLEKYIEAHQYAQVPSIPYRIQMNDFRRAEEDGEPTPVMVDFLNAFVLSIAGRHMLGIADPNGTSVAVDGKPEPYDPTNDAHKKLIRIEHMRTLRDRIYPPALDVSPSILRRGYLPDKPTAIDELNTFLNIENPTEKQKDAVMAVLARRTHLTPNQARIFVDRIWPKYMAYMRTAEPADESFLDNSVFVFKSYEQIMRKVIPKILPHHMRIGAILDACSVHIQSMIIYGLSASAIAAYAHNAILFASPVQMGSEVIALTAANTILLAYGGTPVLPSKNLVEAAKADMQAWPETFTDSPGAFAYFVPFANVASQFDVVSTSAISYGDMAPGRPGGELALEPITKLFYYNTKSDTFAANYEYFKPFLSDNIDKRAHPDLTPEQVLEAKEHPILSKQETKK